MTEGVPGLGWAAVAAVYVPGDEPGELRLTEAVGEPQERYGLPASYPVGGHSPVAEAFRSGRAMWLDSTDLGADRTDAHATLPSYASLGALPLGADGRRLGCLVVVGEAGDDFDAERRDVLELYADQVAARLDAGAEVARAEVDGRPTAEPVPGPALSSLLVGSFSLELRTGRIAADARVLELFGIVPEDFDGRAESLLEHTVPDDVPALMAIVEPGRTSSGLRELQFRIRRPSGELRWLHLRCRVLGDAMGRPERVLGVVTDASHMRPSADEVSRVQRLAAGLANAMTMRDVGRVVVGALRDPLGSDRVALAVLEGDRLVVTVLDPPQPEEWPENWASQWRSEWPDAPARALPTLDAALRDGRVNLWPPGTSLEPSLAGIGPGGLAVLPLPADGRVVGACLVGWEQRHEFSPEERSLLTATAGLVGQALVRARAFDAEHELATMLQRSLLPRTLPALPGGVAVARYLPATVGLEVGGDWYDVIPLSEGHVALVIGDVQGHSAAAATIMGQIRTAIRAYAVEGHPPDVVVSHANRLLVGMETDLFATCAYVDLDMEEGNAWCVRAGHIPPLLREPDGSTRPLGVEGGPPLGVLADAEYPMTTVGLMPGAVLALVTDGLVESASLPLEAGLRGACETLSAADLSDANRLADELLGAAPRRDDDVALLVMRYDGMRERPIRASWTVWRLPDAVMHARRYTARTLRSWSVVEETDAVLLIVSELVTNALVHTQGPVRLDLTLAADRLRVGVSDSSPRAPAKPVSVDWEATGGRGLLLVEAVTASWGSVPVSGGKQVWGEIDLAPSEARPRDDGPAAGGSTSAGSGAAGERAVSPTAGRTGRTAPGASGESAEPARTAPAPGAERVPGPARGRVPEQGRSRE